MAFKQLINVFLMISGVLGCIDLRCSPLPVSHLSKFNEFVRGYSPASSPHFNNAGAP